MKNHAHFTGTLQTINLMEHIHTLKDTEWTVALKWDKKRFKLTENLTLLSKYNSK